jgi:hypothetical protein
MKIVKSDALKAKFEALKWLRLDQRCMFIATEVGGYSADVLGINEKKMIEVEVKVTFEDFKNDFKKHKHHTYSGKYGTEWEKQWIPTHFYFAVPEGLVEKVKAHLDSDRGERTKDYGIIDSSTWKVVKRAKWLHKNPPNNRVKCTTALRMGSELIRFHEAWL